MNIIVITDPNQVDRDGKTLSWREWLSDSTDAAVRIRECKEAGLLVERYNPKKNSQEIND